MNIETVSVIIPVFNEQDNIWPLYEQLLDVRRTTFPGMEIIFADDGSRDNSATVMADIVRADPQTKLVTLKKNFGQTMAIAAGVRASAGTIIVTMDADLQNDPHDIPALVRHMDQGYDVVSGWRQNRQDVYWTRILPSRIANALISFVTGIRLHDFGCTLKAYRREYVENLPLYGEMHRFIPAYCSWQGAKIAELPVNHRPRLHGRSKYGLLRTYKVILDLLVVKFVLSYMSTPMYLFGGVGLSALAAGTLIMGWVVVRRFYGGEWLSPLFFAGILLWSVAVLCILMGIMVEMIVRLYYEMRPHALSRTRSN